MKVHVRKNDTVIVVSGKDKRKIGEVLKVNPKASKIIVQEVNIVRKHQKPAKASAQGGVIERKGAIYSSEVMLYCTKCKNVTRVSDKILEDGTKIRVCRRCGKTSQSPKGGTNYDNKTSGEVSERDNSGYD